MSFLKKNNALNTLIDLIVFCLLIICIFNVNNVLAQSKTNVVAHWTFDDKAGSTMAKNSVFSIDSAKLVNINTTTSWVKGKENGALAFDGVNDYAVIKNTDRLNLKNDFAISVWVYPHVLLNTGSETIIYKASNCKIGYFIRLITGARFEFGSSDCDTDKNANNADGAEDSSNAVSSFNNVMILNEWNHILINMNGNGQNVTMYHNGNMVGSGVLEKNIDANNEDLYIATDKRGTHAFKGKIDDLRIYNKALSQQEIKEIINNTGWIKPNEYPTSGGLMGHFSSFDSGEIYKSVPFTEVDIPDLERQFLSYTDDLKKGSQIHLVGSILIENKGTYRFRVDTDDPLQQTELYIDEDQILNAKGDTMAEYDFNKIGWFKISLLTRAGIDSGNAGLRLFWITPKTQNTDSSLNERDLITKNEQIVPSTHLSPGTGERAYVTIPEPYEHSERLRYKIGGVNTTKALLNDTQNVNKRTALMAWIKATGEGAIITRGNKNNNEECSLNVVGGFAEFNCNFNADAKIRIITKSNTRVDDNKWHHVAGVQSIYNKLEIYVDGKSEGSSTGDIGGYLSATNEVYVGARYGESNFLNGAIDQVRVFGGLFAIPTADQIALIYLNEKGLVGDWQFNELTGNRTKNTIDETQTAILQNMNEDGWVRVKTRSGALKFDGKNDYVDLGTSYLGLSNVSSATILTSIATQMKGAEQSIASFGIANDGTIADKSRLDIGINNKGKIFLGGRVPDKDESDYSSLSTSDYEIPINEWTNLAGVYDIKNKKGLVYENSNVHQISDKFVWQSQATSDGASNSGATFGASADGKKRFFNGFIDKVRVYNYALNKKDIDDIFHQTIDTRAQLGFWSFSEGQGTIAKDSSSSNAQAVLINMDNDSWINGVTGKALFFNGIDQYVQIKKAPLIRTREVHLNIGDFKIKTDGAWIFWGEATKKDSNKIKVTNIDTTKTVNLLGTRYGNVFIARLPQSVMSAKNLVRLAFELPTSLEGGISVLVPYYDNLAPLGKISFIAGDSNIFYNLSRPFVFKVEDTIQLNPFFVMFGGSSLYNQNISQGNIRPNYLMSMFGSELKPKNTDNLAEINGKPITLGSFDDELLFYSGIASAGREGINMDILSPNYSENNWVGAERTSAGYINNHSVSQNSKSRNTNLQDTDWQNINWQNINWIAYQFVSGNFLPDKISDKPESFVPAIVGVYSKNGIIELSGPATPLNVSTKLNCDDDTITISWDVVDGAEKYFVYRCAGGNCTPTILNSHTQNPLTSDKTFLLDALDITNRGETFNYSVRAYDADFNKYSAFTTPIEQPFCRIEKTKLLPTDVMITTNPDMVLYGGDAEIKWQSSGADFCSVKAGDTLIINGLCEQNSQACNGFKVFNLTEDSGYSIDCGNQWGTTTAAVVIQIRAE